jgi:peptidoglycan-associated lipoprotein
MGCCLQAVPSDHSRNDRGYFSTSIKEKEMRRRWIAFAMTMVLTMAFMMVACAKEQVQSQTDPQPQDTTAVAKTGDASRQAAGQQDEQARLREAREAALRAAAAFSSENVQFDFDSTMLTAQARTILNKKAEYLGANPDTRVTIEGHCDERGTAAYNMALGERRADAVKNYLIHLGTSAERLSTISYGEEKPVAQGQDESAWAKNRRAQFVIN